jgi:hypothetical protein
MEYKASPSCRNWLLTPLVAILPQFKIAVGRTAANGSLRVLHLNSTQNLASILIFNDKRPRLQGIPIFAWVLFCWKKKEIGWHSYLVSGQRLTEQYESSSEYLFIAVWMEYPVLQMFENSDVPRPRYVLPNILPPSLGINITKELASSYLDRHMEQISFPIAELIQIHRALYHPRTLSSTIGRTWFTFDLFSPVRRMPPEFSANCFISVSQRTIP